MAETETPLKRLRDNSDEDSNTKRQKPHISTLLGEPEPDLDLTEDFSSIFSILQQDLASATGTELQAVPADDSCLQRAESGADEVESVMRHLLEASDDELGIPNPRGSDCNFSEEITKSGEIFPTALIDNCLWEFEDEAANYYTVLQSELFME